MWFFPSYHLSGSSPLPLDMGYLFSVGSNILLLMVVQQQFVILEFSQERMITSPSTPPFLGFGEVMKIMVTSFKRSHARTTALLHSVPPTLQQVTLSPTQTYMQIHMYLYCGKQRDIFPTHRLSYSLKCYLLLCVRDYSQLAPFLKTEQWFLLGIHLLPRYI